jgi:4-hydroxybenzoate polyprenyltransferase
MQRRETSPFPGRVSLPMARPCGGYAARFFRLIRFEHSVFALPFAYAGAFLAGMAVPGFWRMFWITIAMVAARSLAMALNRLLDARIDALNPRTARREIPAGLLSRSQVWLFALFCLAVLIVATFRLPAITRYLWPLVVIPMVVYPLTKRWSWVCHLVLGGTIGLGPIGAWVGASGTVSWQPFLLGAAVAAWIAGFDVIYAFMDVEFDREHGLHSIPADFGPAAGLWSTRMLHAAAIGLLAGVGVLRGASFLYFVGVAICALLLLYENWVMRKVDLSKVGVAFQTMNGILSVVFFVFTTASLFVG